MKGVFRPSDLSKARSRAFLTRVSVGPGALERAPLVGDQNLLHLSIKRSTPSRGHNCFPLFMILELNYCQ